MPPSRTDPRLSLSQVFTIGLTISLEFEENDAPQYVLSRVEDTSEDRLWAAMPMRGTLFLPLPVGTPVTAYVKKPDDAAYMVRTRVSGRRMQPCPMLELAPVAPIERRQQRQYFRLRITLVPTSAMLIGPGDTETRLAATIINLSAGGLLVRSRIPLAIGQRIRLAFELPPPGGPIGSTVEVLRVDTQRAERGHYYEAGCAFLDLTERERDLITKFAFRFQTRQLQRGPDQSA